MASSRDSGVVAEISSLMGPSEFFDMSTLALVSFWISFSFVPPLPKISLRILKRGSTSGMSTSTVSTKSRGSGSSISSIFLLVPSRGLSSACSPASPPPALPPLSSHWSYSAYTLATSSSAKSVAFASCSGLLAPSSNRIVSPGSPLSCTRAPEGPSMSFMLAPFLPMSLARTAKASSHSWISIWCLNSEFSMLGGRSRPPLPPPPPPPPLPACNHSSCCV
mmetsp:Transcript_139341/g.445583  ORF Transcript_139341/g.445583 Transcript_139341/m.445583 type:complete len:221 (-) Transcript_139341:314-976(-)